MMPFVTPFFLFRKKKDEKHAKKQNPKHSNALVLYSILCCFHTSPLLLSAAHGAVHNDEELF